jgi:hypothetical protein
LCPHPTSLAVWDVTSPVPASGRLKLKTGAKCLASCSLAGHRLEILNEQGKLVGDGQLRDDVLAGMTALYWTEVELPAPDLTGVSTWSVVLKVNDCQVPHGEARASFSFRADPPSEHHVTIELRGQDSQAPLADAEVRLGQYLSISSVLGLAVFHLPTGSYELSIRKDGYEVEPTILAIAKDMVESIEATRTLTQAEREARLERFVDVEWG